MRSLKYFVINYSSLMILFLLIILFSITAPYFFQTRNLVNILRQASFLAIIAMGQTLAILTGGIDLSVGSIIALSTVLVGPMLLTDVPLIIPIFLALLVGAVIGFLNGLIITKLKLPAFIVTFAMMFITRGLAWIYLGRQVIYQFKPSFRFLGAGEVFGIPTPIIFCFAIYFALLFMLKKTILGRNIYFVGSNIKAASFSGIPTDRILLKAYTLCGLIASFAGILYISRLNAAEPSIGTTFNLDSIAAVLIGGAALSGGVGGISGTLIGAIIISIIKNGMNMMQVSSELQSLYLGIIIIISVLFNQYVDLYKKDDILTNKTSKET